MTRSGIRIAEIFDQEIFDTKVRRLASGFQKRYGDLLSYDVEEEITRYREYRQKLPEFVVDQVPLLVQAKEKDANILVEGANALVCSQLC